MKPGVMSRKPTPANRKADDQGCAQACPLQRATIRATELDEVPPVVHDVLRTPGQSLDADTRAFMESRFEHDFSGVRVHTDSRAAQSAQAVNARAYTIGRDVVFGVGEYAPHTTEGQRLVAHELTHVVQQKRGQPVSNLTIGSSTSRHEQQADRIAESFVSGRVLSGISSNHTGVTLQRRITPPVSVRSPVFEETVRQTSVVEAGARGRELTRNETALARSVFGSSISYHEVRLIPTNVLQYRTVGNTIRVPEDFNIRDSSTAEIFIHEMTHVWQYQHLGTSYISESLSDQIVGYVQTGDRGAAYNPYPIRSGQSFFDFRPEQQAMLVQNYYRMLIDQRARRDNRTYTSNHLFDPNQPSGLSWDQRQAEITRELPLYAPLINQMRAALPLNEAGRLQRNIQDLMRLPYDEAIPEERRMPPIRPILEIRF